MNLRHFYVFFAVLFTLFFKESQNDLNAASPEPPLSHPSLASQRTRPTSCSVFRATGHMVPSLKVIKRYLKRLSPDTPLGSSISFQYEGLSWTLKKDSLLPGWKPSVSISRLLGSRHLCGKRVQTEGESSTIILDSCMFVPGKKEGEVVNFRLTTQLEGNFSIAEESPLSLSPLGVCALWGKWRLLPEGVTTDEKEGFDFLLKEGFGYFLDT